MTSAYECPSIKYTLVSSANKIENNKYDDLEKSLTLRINYRDPILILVVLHELCF